MNEDVEISDIRFESLRVPIDCMVDLHFETSSQPTRLKAANLSMSGMFLRTREKFAPGTLCSVHFELQQGQPPIRGQAEVLWNRESSHGPDHPRGVGVRFLELDLDSKYAISRLVDRYLQLDGMPVQLANIDTKVWTRLTKRPTEDIDGQAVVGNNGSGSESEPSRRSYPKPALLAGVFGLGLLIGSLSSLWLLQGSTRASQEMTGLAPRSFGHNITSNVPSTVPSTGPATESLREDPRTTIHTAIDEWARAWSQKDVERYLSCYSANFEPPADQTQDAWKAQRRERLTRPGEIEVEISDVTIEPVTPDRANAQFSQTFTSPGYRDQVIKVLELVKENQAWKILREEAQLP